MIGLYTNMLQPEGYIFCAERQNRTQSVRMRTIIKLNMHFK